MDSFFLDTVENLQNSGIGQHQFSSMDLQFHLNLTQERGLMQLLNKLWDHLDHQI